MSINKKQVLKRYSQRSRSQRKTKTVNDPAGMDQTVMDPVKDQTEMDQTVKDPVKDPVKDQTVITNKSPPNNTGLGKLKSCNTQSVLYASTNTFYIMAVESPTNDIVHSLTKHCHQILAHSEFNDSTHQCTKYLHFIKIYKT